MMVAWEVKVEIFLQPAESCPRIVELYIEMFFSERAVFFTFANIV